MKNYRMIVLTKINKLYKKLKLYKHFNRGTIFALVFGVIGILMLTYSFASTPTAQFESENSTLTGCASVVSDSSASGGSTVSFGCSTKTILLVKGANALNASETALQSRLQSNNYTVTVVTDSAVTTSQADGFNLVIMSKTVTSTNVATKLKASTAPVLFWEDNQQQFTMMTTIDNRTTTGTAWHAAGTQINVSSSVPTELRAGLSGTQNFYTTSTDMTYAPKSDSGAQTLPSGAIRIAQYGANGDGRWVIYAFDKNAALADGTLAKGKRVYFGLYDDSFKTLTSQGQSMFDALVVWTAGVSTAPGPGPDPDPVACTTGVPMTSGQADINNNPAGTTFCLSGAKSNWSLTPKSGNTFIGDGTAVLNGNNTTQWAVLGNSGVTNVTFRNIEFKNYTAASQAGALNLKSAGTGWLLDNLQVHDNAFFGVTIGTNTLIKGGRYYNNRQGGMTGSSNNGWTVDGSEIDHNNFTDNTYTTSNISCGFEAGGIKFVGNDVTIKNTKTHTNACKGLWADLGPINAQFLNNLVYDNWDEGIFFEISTSGTISGNTVYGNGFKNTESGCQWGWSGGITVSTSGMTSFDQNGYVNVTNNTVYDNCNGITLLDQNRQESRSCAAIGRCKLYNVTVSGNTITGTTRVSTGNKTGAWSDTTSDFIQQKINFGTNTINANMNYCKLSC